MRTLWKAVRNWGNGVNQRVTDSGYIQEGSGTLRRAEVVKLMRISGSWAWESNVLS